MSNLVRRIAPERWKVFQVLKVIGQNDGSVESLLITPDEFRAFLDRHRHLSAEGFGATAEDNEAMMDSYVMIDPLGRFFGDSGGQHHVGAPILERGVAAALATVGFDLRKLVARGGIYDWSPHASRRQLPLLPAP